MATDNKPSTKVVTGLVRFSYVHIFEPAAVSEGDDKKYSMSVIIPKSDKKTLSAIKAAVDAAKEAGKASKWGGKVPAKLQTPLRDGDEDRPDDEAYAGCYFFNCASNQKPGIVDASTRPVLNADDVYSGCYGRVAVNFYPYDKNGNKGVAAGLDNVQKLKDGERLGGRAAAEDDFGDGFGEDFEGEDEDFLN